MLTECASAKDASPVFVEPNELAVGGKGLAEYKKSSNMPLPWPGGWWRLADIVQYEITSTISLVKTCGLHRSEILRFRNDLCKSEVGKGRTEAPGYFILPASQKDPGEWTRLIRLLQEHGVRCLRADSDLWAGDQYVRTGDAVVPLAQPFRPFIKEVLEKQTFPVRHYTTDGKIIRPYDVTSWSLPLHAGVRSPDRQRTVRAARITYHGAGGSLRPRHPLHSPRVPGWPIHPAGMTATMPHSSLSAKGPS